MYSYLDVTRIIKWSVAMETINGLNTKTQHDQFKSKGIFMNKNDNKIHPKIVTTPPGITFQVPDSLASFSHFYQARAC